jgi:hypothetical protein
MNWKKLWLAALAVYVVYLGTMFLIHGVILGGYYMKPDLVNIWRPEAEMSAHSWLRFLTMAVFAYFFTFIFAKGHEKKGLMEGIRFGIYIGLFTYFVSSFEQFIIFPIPHAVAWYWTLAGLVQCVLMGVTAALIYRPKTT